MVFEVYEQAPARQRESKPVSQAGVQPDAPAVSRQDLPAMNLVDSKDFKPLPWEQPDNGSGHKMHMNYRLQKDSIIKNGEGPYHVSRRLLGQDASEADVRTLTRALKEQYGEENNKDSDMQSLRIGQSLVTEKNIRSIMRHIEDPETRQRIGNSLKEGWTEKEQPAAVPFDHDARPGETQPSVIEDRKSFQNDLAAAAIDVGAAKLRSQGHCAQGARLALNEVPLWHIDGGTVDTSIKKDPNGWRSGLRLAQDLADTGLFDSVPLKKIGTRHLQAGYILGRSHHPDYVKDHPEWGGEDYGDIDIVTKKHTPPADGKFYQDSFVLIPKKVKA